MRSVRRRGFVALALGAFAILLMAAYAFSMRGHRGEVAPRVQLAGVDVGGMDRAELNRTLAGLAARYEAAKVRIRAPGGSFTTTASELGLRLDRVETAANAMKVGRGGLPVSRLWSWTYSFLSARSAAVEVTVDRTAASNVINAKDPGPHTPPLEPTISYDDGGFVAVPGRPGRGMDVDEVVTELEAAAGGRGLITLTVGRRTVQPRFAAADAQRVADEATRLVKEPIALTVGGQEASVSLAQLRPWATAVISNGRMRFAIDGERAATDLNKRFPRAGIPAAETTFNVVGGAVQIVPGRVGTSCCDPSVGALVERALRGQLAQPVEAPLRRIEPKISPEQAQSLGIKEIVGTFTTRHPAGQPRVKNIHRIADLMRGQVILPNSSISVNAIVGRRTAARGFVNAPVIQEGLFAEDFGGGVSQFATTLFNAAFLAGLEFPEYQSHSIYLTRYPYGREATLNYPHPDLKIRNSTPHGVLIWPTYSSTGITVTLYSTKYWKTTQTGQSKSPSGVCTRVRTERTRVRLSDNLTKKDAVFATYRPEEGVNCNGTRTGTTTTVAPSTTVKKTTTTTAKPPVTTAAPPPPTTATTAPPPPP